MNYDWIDNYIGEIVHGKKRKRCIQYGIDHLPSKKLYKYYSLSSKYTIENIKNSVVFLQNPIEFNDPFDCNIGISVNQLFRILSPNIFDKALSNTTNDVKDILQAWFFGESDFDFTDNSKEKLVAIFANSPVFMELIKKAQDEVIITDQECLNAILSDAETATEMIKTYLSVLANGESLDFNESFMHQIIKAPQILKSMITNVAGSKKDAEVKILELLTSDEDFIRKIESVSSFLGVEIPRNIINKTYNDLDKGIKEFRKKLGQNVGVECFTQSPNDVLMWSYYANKHSGICVEYDFSKMFTTLSNAFLLPVIYSANRPLLNIEKLYDPVSKQVKQTIIKEEFSNIIRSMITKSLEWEREKEWRIVSFLKENDSSRIVKLPIISRIITGINISYEDFVEMEKIAKEKCVPIHRTRLNNEKYRIEIIDE